MIILQIEHPVASFDGWKKVFESDPVGREKGGVKRYRISRKVDDPNFVIVDLEFDDLSSAKNFLGGLRKMWGNVTGSVINNPQGRIIEVVESYEY
jgi:hypothetical protein